MANCINYECADALGAHLPNECGEELLAGGSGMVLLECNHQLTDASSASQINAEIAAGRAKKIDNVKIGLDEPAPIQVDSNLVGATQTLISYNRSGTMTDSNVNDVNRALYDQIGGGRTFGGAIIYIKGTEESAQALVTWIDAPLRFTGGLPIQNNNDQIMVFNYKFAWRMKDMPTLPNAPVGIFT